VVVGDDAPTLAAAVEQAPPNTTVAVPPGRYDANVTVDAPVTIRGTGPDTVLDGGENGSVVRLRADGAAVTSLTIAGVGPEGVHPYGEVNVSRYRDRTMAVYGQSDAGVSITGANDSLVADVQIRTPASGIVVRYSDGVLVDNVTVRGTDDPDSGLMGVLPMYSRVVIQDSTFTGGRDGVYTHRAHGSVVRGNDIADLRYGLHEMYTSDLLVRNNTVRDTTVGLMLMTRPTGNLLVGNHAADSEIGLLAVGDVSYVAENVVVDNQIGLTVGTTRSLVVHNTAVGNEVGLRAGTIMPTNQVTGNDVVGNERPVDASGGPVHVWTVAGRGNYWGAAPGVDRDGDGALDRAFYPGDPVDLAAGRTPGGPTLARSPALGLLRGLSAQLPGLRQRGIVDLAPLAHPARPDALAAARNASEVSAP
jgi:nitrous oxidase accessory protein NosD